MLVHCSCCKTLLIPETKRGPLSRKLCCCVGDVEPGTEFCGCNEKAVRSGIELCCCSNGGTTGMKLCCCGCCGVEGWNGGAFGLNENGAAWVSAGCWLCGGGLF
jgi:hypothetical protein